MRNTKQKRKSRKLRKLRKSRNRKLRGGSNEELVLNPIELAALDEFKNGLNSDFATVHAKITELKKSTMPEIARKNIIAIIEEFESKKRQKSNALDDSNKRGEEIVELLSQNTLPEGVTLDTVMASINKEKQMQDMLLKEYNDIGDMLLKYTLLATRIIKRLNSI